MKRMIKKLSYQMGETIGETLVALLISALALMMLAGAVSSGMRIVTRSKEKMDQYYQVNNAVVAQLTTAPTINGTEATSFGKGNLTTVSISYLLPTDDPSLPTIPPISYWQNDEFSDIPVITYSKTKTGP